MEGLLDVRGAKNMARFISVCFLVVHLSMVAVFWRCQVMPMVIFNIGSIAFYLLSFILIKKELFALFTDLVYIEVVAHMTSAILLTGWGSDFQVTLVGMCCFAFFSEYLERFLNVRHARALPLCVLGAVAYLSSCAVDALRPAPYHLPEAVSLFLRLAWGAVVFCVSCAVLHAFVREATRSEQVLAKSLMHDKLTGLPNRYYVARHLERLSKGAGLDGHWVAVADIDDFKRVNDTYGHNCGDLVLTSVAHLLKENLGDAQVCRWGGEEFLIIGRIGNGMKAQVDHLDRARIAIARHSLWYEESRIDVTVTIGVAAYERGQTTSEWINAADGLLYEGKGQGKNRVVA